MPFEVLLFWSNYDSENGETTGYNNNFTHFFINTQMHHIYCQTN